MRVRMGGPAGVSNACAISNRMILVATVSCETIPFPPNTLFPPLGACAHFGACADHGRGL